MKLFNNNEWDTVVNLAYIRSELKENEHKDINYHGLIYMSVDKDGFGYKRCVKKFQKSKNGDLVFVKLKKHVKWFIKFIE